MMIVPRQRLHQTKRKIKQSQKVIIHRQKKKEIIQLMTKKRMKKRMKSQRNLQLIARIMMRNIFYVVLVVYALNKEMVSGNLINF